MTDISLTKLTFSTEIKAYNSQGNKKMYAFFH